MTQVGGVEGSESAVSGSRASISRRCLLQGIAAGGFGLGAAGLAGCAADPSAPGAAGLTTTPAAAPSPAPSNPSPSTPAPSSPAPSTPAPSTPAGAAEALVATSEVPVGGGVVLGNEKVVVTQPRAGQFRGFSATCTHQGCTVAGVDSGTITCYCHGSAFDAATGAVKDGPAKKPLPEVPVRVEGGAVIRA